MMTVSGRVSRVHRHVLRLAMPWSGAHDRAGGGPAAWWAHLKCPAPPPPPGGEVHWQSLIRALACCHRICRWGGALADEHGERQPCVIVWRPGWQQVCLHSTGVGA